MTERTLVSVVLPVRNAEQYIGEAVRSILDQRHAELELVVVDDGSIDNTRNIVEAFTDRRIRLVEIDEHRNLAHALNFGIATAIADVIAIMNADDVADPGRLSAQVAFLDNAPDVGIVGTWATAIDEAGSPLYEMSPVTRDGQIRFEMLFRSRLIHPTVIFRRAVFDAAGGYDEERYPAAEDIFLWQRMLPLTRFANVPQSLLTYRIHGESLTAHRAAQQREATVNITLETLRGVDVEVDPVVLRALQLREYDPISARAGVELVRVLLAAFSQREIDAAVRRDMRERAANELLAMALPMRHPLPLAYGLALDPSSVQRLGRSAVRHLARYRRPKG